MYQLDELVAILTEAARTRGSKEFRAAPDVIAALMDAVPERESEPWPSFMPEKALYDLMAVPLIEDSTYASGYFQLQLHDRCHAHVEERLVTHPDCPITHSGTVAFDR